MVLIACVADELMQTEMEKEYVDMSIHKALDLFVAKYVDTSLTNSLTAQLDSLTQETGERVLIYQEKYESLCSRLNLGDNVNVSQLERGYVLGIRKELQKFRLQRRLSHADFAQFTYTSRQEMYKIALVIEEGLTPTSSRHLSMRRGVRQHDAQRKRKHSDEHKLDDDDEQASQDGELEGQDDVQQDDNKEAVKKIVDVRHSNADVVDDPEPARQGNGSHGVSLGRGRGLERGGRGRGRGRGPGDASRGNATRGSHSQRDGSHSQRDDSRSQRDDSRSQRQRDDSEPDHSTYTCYGCGKVGHIRMNCPVAVRSNHFSSHESDRADSDSDSDSADSDSREESE